MLNPKLALQQIVVWYTGLVTHEYDDGHAPTAPAWTPTVQRAGVGEPGVKYADAVPGHAAEIGTRTFTLKFCYKFFLAILQEAGRGVVIAVPPEQQ